MMLMGTKTGESLSMEQIFEGLLAERGSPRQTESMARLVALMKQAENRIPLLPDCRERVIKHISAVDRLNLALSYPSLQKFGKMCPLQFKKIILSNDRFSFDKAPVRFFPKGSKIEVLFGHQFGNHKFIRQSENLDETMNQVLEKMLFGVVSSKNPLLVDQLELSGRALDQYPEWFKVETQEVKLRGQLSLYEGHLGKMIQNDPKSIIVMLQPSETSGFEDSMLRQVTNFTVDFQSSNRLGVRHFMTNVLPTLRNKQIVIKTGEQLLVTNDQFLEIVGDWFQTPREITTSLHITRAWSTALQALVEANFEIINGYFAEIHNKQHYNRPCTLVSLPNDIKFVIWGSKDYDEEKGRKQKMLKMTVIKFKIDPES